MVFYGCRWRSSELMSKISGQVGISIACIKRGNQCGRITMAAKKANSHEQKPGPVINVEPSGWSEVRRPGAGIPQASEAEAERNKSDRDLEKADKVSRTAQDSNKETGNR